MPARRRRLLAAAFTAAACLGAQALALTAAGAATASADVVSRGVTIPAFYTPPTT
ncbi:triacylglycerol lipase, partial [Streptomyces sp. MBT65]|nr:triacylglycerol lipase [Streptomyces sp. MBT65]